MQGTGGGPSVQISFTNFEEEVLEFLTPEAAGLADIPEGGINVALNEKDQEEEEEINMQTVGENIGIDIEMDEDTENISTNIFISEKTDSSGQKQKENKFLNASNIKKGKLFEKNNN